MWVDRTVRARMGEEDDFVIAKEYYEVAAGERMLISKEKFKNFFIIHEKVFKFFFLVTLNNMINFIFNKIFLLYL